MSWGLRASLLASVLASVGVAGLGSLLLIEHIERGQRVSLTREAAENFVLLQKARVLAGIQYDLGLARKLAAAEPLRRWILQPGPETLRPAIDELRSVIALTSSKAAFYSSGASASFHYLDLAAIEAIAAQAEPRIPVTQTLAEDDPESAWFYKTLNQPQPYIFNVDYNTQLDLTKLWINVKILDGATPIGVVGTGVDISLIVDSVLQSEGEGVRAMFINARGEVEGEFNPALFGEGVAAPTIWPHLGGPDEHAALAAALVEVESGRRDSASLALHWDGAEQVLALAFLPELQWFVLALHDPSPASGRSGSAPLLLVLFAGLLASAGLIVLVANRRLFTPLRGLAEAGQQLAAGGTPGALFAIAQREDELGGIASALLQLSTRGGEGGGGRAVFGQLAARLQQADSEQALADTLFAGLASALTLGQASLYRAEAGAERLRLCGSYARLDGAAPACTIAYGEGLLGQCARERRPIDLDPAPSGFLHFGSALGDGAARAILLRPLCNADALVGVLELATRETPTAAGRALLDDLLPVLTLCLDNLARARHTADQRAGLQRLIDHSPVCTAFTAEGRFRFVNPAFERSFGTGRGDSAVGMYAHADDRARVLDMLRRDGAVRGEVLAMRMADGSERPFRVTLIPYVHEGESGVLGWLIDLHDDGAGTTEQGVPAEGRGSKG